MLSIDLNCDLGESTHLWPYDIKNELALLPYISSMNLACGLHAGDPHTLHELVQAGLRANLRIGAHPGFNDRENFGRKELKIAPHKIYDLVLYQLGALQGFLSVHNGVMHHVKPHGALYNMAARDATLAAAIASAVKAFNPRLILMGLAGSQLIRMAEVVGLPTSSEVFADRSYQADGSLTPRDQPGALLDDPEKVVAQITQMLNSGSVTTVDGQEIPVFADTVCIHGDGSNALELAKAIHTAVQLTI
ncbi:MAG: LamB/YcsF family protein [Candidatus Pseudobacter hemicellulosilyticus]|uniref:LamB/YcsF family protein n=1 Tax=Candidatus Pseudobacter hemicellulosilyticus TaxID=3121375 RepID=A0AAJ5WPA2_9BACT|nr:MAG: LamB/YcsF family protein [Pseudobacter sp.]